MTIEYIDPMECWSEAVIYNGIVYYTSVPINLVDDAYIQTQSALTEIDKMLVRVGSDKNLILDATIFIVDKADLPAMNQAWKEWVVKGRAPVRCTVQANLMHDDYKVEIKIIAGLKNNMSKQI
ncbi:RidA family protein [Frischella sp. Ac48]|uniref:RidA family protein n=1 Tax=Frischella sp. Ac48 TaxID=2804531 RepID=UPI001C7DC1C1|nr:RidA family protein [Frischella sp. Ac48]MBX4133287.1 RidA family protein [Frischella sp. Ac48]